MSNWLKYYDEEMEIFKKWQGLKVDPNTATKAIKKLQRHYNILPVEVKYRHGENAWSWAISANLFRDNTLSLNVDRLNWLLLAHEFAHLVLDHRRITGVEAPGRDHGPAHRNLVSEILDYINKLQWHKGGLKPRKINRYMAKKEEA